MNPEEIFFSFLAYTFHLNSTRAPGSRSSQPYTLIASFPLSLLQYDVYLFFLWLWPNELLLFVSVSTCTGISVLSLSDCVIVFFGSL